MGDILTFTKRIPPPAKAVTSLGEHAKTYMDYVTAWQLFWLYLLGMK